MSLITMNIFLKPLLRYAPGVILGDIFVIIKFILGFVDKHRPDRVQFPKAIKCNAIFLRFMQL